MLGAVMRLIFTKAEIVSSGGNSSHLLQRSGTDLPIRNHLRREGWELVGGLEPGDSGQ